jgi:histone-lysine N-methyltransferase SETMAR
MLTDDHKSNEKFKWDMLDHPPYSPGLAPSDFHLFLHLKKHFAGKKFDDDDVQAEVMTWFKGQAADFYDSGIQKLVPRLNKCLDNVGDYIEKVMYRKFIHSIAFVN